MRGFILLLIFSHANLMRWRKRKIPQEISRGANYKEGLLWCNKKNGLLLVLQATAVKQETREITLPYDDMHLEYIYVFLLFIYTHTLARRGSSPMRSNYISLRVAPSFITVIFFSSSLVVRFVSKDSTVSRLKCAENEAGWFEDDTLARTFICAVRYIIKHW